MSFANTQRHRFTVTFTLADGSVKTIRRLASGAADAMQLAARQLWGHSTTCEAMTGFGPLANRWRISSRKHGTFEAQVAVQAGYVR